MNRKYNKKNIPKAWKKKKSNRFNTQKKNEWPRMQKSVPKTKSPLQNRQNKKHWKIPGMVGIGSLVTTILIIPALIVFPFGKTDHSQAVTVDKESPPVAEEASVEPESSFSVSVMRAQSEQIEDVPLEKYVAHVVASEMPADFEPEALKAQSLAARTYIVNHMLYQDEDDSEDSDVNDTTEHQVYQDSDELREQMEDDYEDKMAKINEAVSETEGEIITYDDETITPAYFSTSNGYTENAGDYWDDDIPYLESVESPWDKDSPKFDDQEVFSFSEVEDNLGVSLSSDEAFEISHTDSGRVDTMDVGEETLSGREVREALDLRSSDFEVEQKDDHLVFKTKGFGHGIGMSQYGADGMAEEGKTYEDIIDHYYHDVSIDQVDDIAPTLAEEDSEE